MKKVLALLALALALTAGTAAVMTSSAPNDILRSRLAEAGTDSPDVTPIPVAY